MSLVKDNFDKAWMTIREEIETRSIYEWEVTRSYIRDRHEDLVEDLHDVVRELLWENGFDADDYEMYADPDTQEIHDTITEITESIWIHR